MNYAHKFCLAFELYNLKLKLKLKILHRIVLQNSAHTRGDLRDWPEASFEGLVILLCSVCRVFIRGAIVDAAFFPFAFGDSSLELLRGLAGGVNRIP